VDRQVTRNPENLESRLEGSHELYAVSKVAQPPKSGEPAGRSRLENCSIEHRRIYYLVSIWAVNAIDVSAPGALRLIRVRRSADCHLGHTQGLHLQAADESPTMAGFLDPLKLRKSFNHALKGFYNSGSDLVSPFEGEADP
jgi:hypothetical protein